jgi:uncharacterized protein YecT (DUF1311 family)
MRALIHVGFGLAALLLHCSSVAEPVLNQRALREECGALSQAHMRDCLTTKANESKESLRQAEADAVRVLSNWDEDEQYVEHAKTELAAAGRAFAQYRQMQCGFSSSLSGGAAGNARQIRRLACVAELNNQRAEQLRQAVYGLPGR